MKKKRILFLDADINRKNTKMIYESETWEGILRLLWLDSFFETTFEEYQKELIYRASLIAGRKIRHSTWKEFFKELERIKIIKIL